MNLFRQQNIRPADWIIDSVVQFVCSQIFSAPILDFIEERCIVFDSDEENKFSYTDAHLDFGYLIDSQLGDFISDTGIKPNDFAAALAMDISAHQGVNQQTLQDAFKFIKAVDDFLQFKDIMVRTNKDLNRRALEMLERSGMLSPALRTQAASTVSYQRRESYSPPPPYVDDAGYEEDCIPFRRLPVSDEEVESFVQDLSTHPQQFEEAMKEQQQALELNLGVMLADAQTQLGHLTISDSMQSAPRLPTTDSLSTPSNLYPKLDCIVSDPNLTQDFPVATESTNLVQPPETMIPSVPIQHDDVTRSSDNAATASGPGISEESGINAKSVLGEITSSVVDSTPVSDDHPKELDVENTEIEDISSNPTESEIISIPEPQKEFESIAINTTETAIPPAIESYVKEHPKELVAENTNLEKEGGLTEVDGCPAEKLTQQWMDYAKDQQQIWKSVSETNSRNQGAPTSEDLAKREEYFRRQRDLLRKQRKHEREHQQTHTQATSSLPPAAPSSPLGDLPPLIDPERERVRSEEAKKFRKALAAQLRKEVVEKSKSAK